jgi:multidrug efflux pump subunit AcrA (membrane-fusion protein)
MMTRVKIPPMARIIFILIVPAFFLLYLLLNPLILKSQEEEEGESAALEEMEAQVKTEPLKSGELPVVLAAMGTCIAGHQSPAIIISRIQEVVKEVNVLDGQQVESGQIIAHLDDRVARANYEKAKAEFQTAEMDLKNAENGGLDVMQGELDAAARDATVAADQAKLQSNHEDELLAERLTSERAAKDARSAMEIALIKATSENKKAEMFRSGGRDMELKRLKAAYTQAQAELNAAQLNLDSTVIRSPLKGRVGGLNLTVGTPTDTMAVIGHITGENTIAFRLWVSPQDAQKLTVGFPASIYPLLSKESIVAKIISIGGGMDDETGLVPVEAQPVEKNTGNLRIKEAVTAEITTSINAWGFLVPVSSITLEDDKASVFLVDDKMIAHAVPVNILSRNAEQAVIEGESLKEGSIVIVDGNYNLPDGAHISQGDIK